MGKGINTELMIKAFAINAEIEGMKADNMQRASMNESMAYWGSDFDSKAEELRSLLEDEVTISCSHNVDHVEANEFFRELESNSKSEIPCDCNGVAITHKLGCIGCKRKIADIQPKIHSTVKGVSEECRKKDIFIIKSGDFVRIISRQDLGNQSYKLQGNLWTVDIDKEIM